jgi:HSP20 family protein
MSRYVNTNQSISDILSLISGIPVEQTYDFPVDMIDDEKTIVLYCQLPGLKNSDIAIDVFNNKINIQGQKHQDYDISTFSSACNHTTEIRYGKFERTITLPLSITKKESINVSYKDGMLKITIDKTIEETNRFSVSF